MTPPNDSKNVVDLAINDLAVTVGNVWRKSRLLAKRPVLECLYVVWTLRAKHAIGFEDFLNRIEKDYSSRFDFLSKLPSEGFVAGFIDIVSETLNQLDARLRDVAVSVPVNEVAAVVVVAEIAERLDHLDGTELMTELYRAAKWIWVGRRSVFEAEIWPELSSRHPQVPVEFQAVCFVLTCTCVIPSPPDDVGKMEQFFLRLAGNARVWKRSDVFPINQVYNRNFRRV